MSRPERRQSERCFPHRVAAVSCLRGSMGLGPNLAVSLLDLSEGGAGLVLREPLPEGEEVELTLEPVGSGRTVRLLAEVVWCEPAEGDRHRAGVRFRAPLGHAELFDLVRFDA